MRILNVMLGKGLGGIEQAALDYALGLSKMGHYVVSVMHPAAQMNAAFAEEGLPLASLSNWGAWDVLAPCRLRKLAKQCGADIVLVHGNRAMTLAKRGVGGQVPVVAIAHNYKFQHLQGVDAVFAITRHMMQEIAALGVAEERIFHAPNMIRIPEYQRNRELSYEEGAQPVAAEPVAVGQMRSWQHPPVIGALGRFVAKKGFDVYLEALAELQSRGVPFQAVLGGGGDEETALKAQASSLGLSEETLRFVGWVKDVPQFLREIDVFCLPSHHEPFGIVLLEAMLARLPIVSTDSEGPSEIVTDRKHALLVPKGNALEMANALEDLLESEMRAKMLGQAAFEEVRSRYSMLRRSEQLSKNLAVVYNRFHAQQEGDAA